MNDSIDARFAQLMRYISRGWALTPLHDVGGVPGGPCSCRLGAACRSAGKHPRSGTEWQRPENLVRDEAGVRTALELWPSCNWGLATGLISGVWALDFDPKDVKPETADEVARVLDACWAAATWVQETGSKGWHFLFTLPMDFTPDNASKKLPPGFDVRGARRGEVSGGQIVLAPSVSGVGSYRVLADRPVTAAPDSVAEAVRPAPPRQRAIGVMPAVTASADQQGRYAERAIEGELAELRTCWTSRNQRAWRAAARVLEFANTGLAAHEAVYEAWWAAAQAHPDLSVRVPDTELLNVWGSAERHVGDRPADLSMVGGPSSWWGGDAITPTHAPAAVPMLGGGAGAADAGNGYPQGVRGAVDNAGQPLVNALTSDVNDPIDAMIARMLTPEQLKARPNPAPLINGILDKASCAWLIGAPGSFKSFVALDFAAHVGLGLDWHGHRVHQGLVIYVIAEGDTGMKLREAAWDREYRPLKDVLFLAEPVQADERRAAGQWTVLVEACRRLQPALVIIDTQARVTIGLKENDNSDMSYYAEQADRIKRATGACVLTVHHIGRSGGDARGASALDGAQDAELKVERTPGALSFKLISDKQKDQAQEGAIALTMRRSEGGADQETGRDLSSLVVDGSGTSVPVLSEAQGPYEAVSVTRARAMYKGVQVNVNHGAGASAADFRKWLKADDASVASQSASGLWHARNRAWNDLIALGLVIKRSRAQLFKVLVLEDQGIDGVLTPNSGEQARDAPEGWSIWWPDNETANKHADEQLQRVGKKIRNGE